MATKATPTRRTVAPTFATVDHGHDKPRIPYSPMFMLVFVPTRWQIMSGKLVPQLATIPLEPGTNLIEGTTGGGIRASRLSARMAEEGRIRIPYEWAPDGESYIQVVETRVGASDIDTFVSVFEEVYAGDSATHCDVEAYAGWLESLVTSKKLPPCPPYQVRRMMDQEHARCQVAEASVKAHDTGPNRAALEAHQGNLKALEEAWKVVNPKASGKKPVARKRVATKVEV